MIIAETTHGGRIDKVSRYGWSVSDAPGVFKMIHKTQLHVDREYQRNAKDVKIKAIARDWSWIAFGALIVADRDGDYYVIDGQHRVMAAMTRSDIDALPCIVFKAATVADEAAGFLRSNKNRKPVSALETYRAKLVSGDKTALYVDDLFRRHNVKVSGTSHAFGIKCISLVFRLAEQQRASLEAMFPIAVELARDGGIAVPERILDGLCYLHRHGTHDDLSSPKWRDRILKIGLPALSRAAAEGAVFYAKGGATAWANGMLRVINSGLRNKYEINGGRE